jgi:hypothetical protein
MVNIKIVKLLYLAGLWADFILGDFYITARYAAVTVGLIIKTY